MELNLNRISLVLKNLSTKNYDKKEESFDVILSLQVNGQNETVSKRYKYNPKPEEMAVDFMKFVKSKYMYNDMFDNTLKHNLVVIDKFEEIEEKMLNFIKRINDKIKDFKNYRTSMSYFEMNNTMNSLSFNF